MQVIYSPLCNVMLTQNIELRMQLVEIFEAIRFSDHSLLSKTEEAAVCFF